jgi:endonuclease YncB( thermonuclease family)
MRCTVHFIVVMLVMLLSMPSWAADPARKVIVIHDGDTLTLLVVGHDQVRARLAEIDTSEHSQPWDGRARQALVALAYWQQARVVVIDTDRYRRTVGRVWLGSLDVNAQLIHDSHTWYTAGTRTTLP